MCRTQFAWSFLWSSLVGLSTDIPLLYTWYDMRLSFESPDRLLVVCINIVLDVLDTKLQSIFSKSPFFHTSTYLLIWMTALSTSGSLVTLQQYVSVTAYRPDL